jgi:hypothetical protein
MAKRFTKADLRRINGVSSNNTKRIADYVAKALFAVADGEREKRLQVHECAYCYYLRGPRLVGQAFTDWKCLACGVEGSHPNTGVPRYCNACSDAYHLCVECGGDLSLRFRTKIIKGMR